MDRSGTSGESMGPLRPANATSSSSFSPIVKVQVIQKDDKFTVRRFTWSRVPNTKEEFELAQSIIGRSAEGSCALFCMGALIFSRPKFRSLGSECLRLFVIHPKANVTRCMRSLEGTLTQKRHIARSYFRGALPHERYALSTNSPLVCDVKTQALEERSGRLKAFVYSEGADTARPITSKVDESSGYVKAYEFSSIQVDVVPPGIHRDWRDPRSETILLETANRAIQNLFHGLRQCAESGATQSAMLTHVKPLMHSTVNFKQRMRFSISKAVKRVCLYAAPPQISRFDVRRSSTPQTLGIYDRGTLVQGTFVKAFVDKIDGEPGRPAPLHLFFPKDGGSPTFTNIGSL
eukprot:g3957.t1